MTTIWYHVRDLPAARDFYTSKLGFRICSFDDAERWAMLERDACTIGIAEGEPQKDGAVAHVDVTDMKQVADELRDKGVDVGVVLELHGEMRLLDVYDPDGNRLQFAEEL